MPVLLSFRNALHRCINASSAKGSLASTWRLISTGEHDIEAKVGDTNVRFASGKLARLADGACVVSLGGTQVLSTAVWDSTFDETRDFLNLQVDYKEPGSATGTLPLTHSRREGTFNEREILASRAIDRAIRPLFPPGFFYDTHITAHVLSRDADQDPDLLAINAASAALTCSSIPFCGPVGAVRIGQVEGMWVVNPRRDELEASSLNLTYAGTATQALMVECVAHQVPEQLMEEALRLAQQEVGKLVAPQLELARKLGKRKRRVQLVGASPAALQAVRAVGEEMMQDMLRQPEASKLARAEQVATARQLVLQRLREKGLLGEEGQGGELKMVEVNWAVEEVERGVLRRLALEEGVRADGRAPWQLRPITCLSPALAECVHGSALFERGDTQSLCSTTISSDRWASQAPVLPTTRKTFMLHYSFPPLAVNEVGKAGMPSRREVGHGNLAERALAPVMPPNTDFPFIVRVNADTLMSNGSSSMAAVCGGAMALKDAGVPIKDLVAGISIGLVAEKFPVTMAGEVAAAPAGTSLAALQEYGKEVLLTDIQGTEDHVGDMDFKVAGSARGLTALQLDTKLPGLEVGTLVKALAAARTARMQLLGAMELALQEGSREGERPHCDTVSINQELIARLVGPEGTNLLKIEEETGGRLTVMDTGEIHIWAPTQRHWDAAAAAVRQVEGANLKEGEVYTVRVVRLLDHGAYVEVPGGMITLLHISELTHQRIRGIRDVLEEGQMLEVKCLGKDARGMVRLSRKALLVPPPPPQKDEKPAKASPQSEIGRHHPPPVNKPKPPSKAGSEPHGKPQAQQQQQQQQQQRSSSGLKQAAAAALAAPQPPRRPRAHESLAVRLRLSRTVNLDV